MSETAPVENSFHQQPLPVTEPSGSRLPTFDIGIEDRCVSQVPHVFAGGFIEDRTYRISDGTIYNVQRFQPRVQKFDTAATYTTPWVTDLDGFNTEMGKSLANEGMPAIAVSPEQSALPAAIVKLVKTIFNDTSLLAHDAKVHNLILDDFDTQGVLPTSLMMGVGYSRGGMTGLGINSYAKQHERRFAFSNFVDLCIEHKVEPGEVSPVQLATYLCIEEPVELLRALTKYSPRQLRNLCRTLRITPGFVANQVSTGVAIFSGEAGSFVDSLPPDSAMRIELFKRSQLNQAASWQRRLQPFTNIHLGISKGVHMSGVRPEIGLRAVAHVVRAQELVQAGVPAGELDVAQIVKYVQTQED